MCGDDLSQRAKEIAELKFEAFKKDFETQRENEKIQHMMQNGQAGDVVNSGNFSDQNFQNQIKDLRSNHDEKVKNFNEEIEAQKMLSVYLINEIEKYKTQTFLSEQNIMNSGVVKALKNDAAKLLEKIQS